MNALQRRAAAGIVAPFLGVTPNASKGTNWRTTVGYGYPFGEVEEPAAPTGGGGRRLRRRYPRRVYIEGVPHWVYNPEEERQLLRAHIEALEEKAEAQPAAKAKKTLRIIARVKRRLEAVDERENAWLKRLRREDDEILMLLH